MTFVPILKKNKLSFVNNPSLLFCYWNFVYHYIYSSNIFFLGILHLIWCSRWFSVSMYMQIFIFFYFLDQKNILSLETLDSSFLSLILFSRSFFHVSHIIWSIYVNTNIPLRISRYIYTHTYARNHKWSLLHANGCM